VDLAIELRKQNLFREIVDTPRITLRSPAEPVRVENRNALVLEEPFVDGIKTGTTLEAGYVLVASGTRKGIELVSVVLGSPDEASRDAATLDLLDYGFSLYDDRKLVKKGEPLGFARLADGGRLRLEASGRVTEVARADQKVEVTLAETAPLTPPVAKGDPVAVAVVRLDGQKVGEVDAVASRTVAGLPEPEEESSGLPSWAWIVFGGAFALALLLGTLAIRAHRRE
jgi:D-alanyl-D-alanine carboxypeptidase (penicillin-binding protein 5/6)